MGLLHGRADQMAPGWARVWLYGSAGSGKTIAASTFPQPYFLVPHNEDSIKALRGMPFGYTSIVPDGANLRGEILGFVEHLLAMRPEELWARYGQTLVLEAFTHLCDMLVNEVSQLNVTRGDKPGEMHQQKWGLLRTYFLHLRDQLWRLPMHVVFTSLDYAKTDPQGNLIRGGPAGGGSASDLIPSSCDALGYCETQGNGRIITFQQVKVFPARTRYRGMPPGPYQNTQLWQALAPYLGYSG
jgi:hypothetical protein